MVQYVRRRFRPSELRNLSDPVTSGVTVTKNDVVQSMFANGAVPAYPTSSIWAANDFELAIAKSGLDWKYGAAVHGGPRPDDTPAWSGAPWTWTIGGVTDDTLRYHNVWYEVVPYALTGYGKGVRVQFRNIESWTITSALIAWVKTRAAQSGEGVPLSGAPDGGYFQTTPNYQKTVGIEGWSSGGTTTNGYTYTASPGAKWRTEPGSNGGGYSITLDPITTAGGAVIDDFAILHGPFQGFTLPNRVQVPDGGYNAWSGQMRLIMEDGSPVPSSAKWVACLGGDVFNANDNSDPASARSTSQANPRHKVLTGNWQWFGYCSGSENMIRNTFPALPFVNA